MRRRWRWINSTTDGGRAAAAAIASWGNMLKALCQNFYEWMRMHTIYTYWTRLNAQPIAKTVTDRAGMRDLRAQTIASILLTMMISEEATEKFAEKPLPLPEIAKCIEPMASHPSDGSTSWAVKQTLKRSTVNSMRLHSIQFDSIRLESSIC